MWGDRSGATVSAWFQVMSKSSRLISPDATNPARRLETGGFLLGKGVRVELDIEAVLQDQS
jgi:hypothetical protein